MLDPQRTDLSVNRNRAVRDMTYSSYPSSSYSALPLKDVKEALDHDTLEQVYLRRMLQPPINLKKITDAMMTNKLIANLVLKSGNPAVYKLFPDVIVKLMYSRQTLSLLRVIFQYPFLVDWNGSGDDRFIMDFEQFASLCKHGFRLVGLQDFPALARSADRFKFGQFNLAFPQAGVQLMKFVWDHFSQIKAYPNHSASQKIFTSMFRWMSVGGLKAPVLNYLNDKSLRERLGPGDLGMALQVSVFNGYQDIIDLILSLDSDLTKVDSAQYVNALNLAVSSKSLPTLQNLVSVRKSMDALSAEQLGDFYFHSVSKGRLEFLQFIQSQDRIMMHILSILILL